MTFKEILAETISARILEREANVPREETNGFLKAYRAWADGNAKDNPEARWQNYDTRTIILEKHFFEYITEDEAPDFLSAAKANGVNTIIITDTSTALMRTIHALCNAGAELAGLTTATRKQEFFEPRPQPEQAIKLTIPTETAEAQTAEKTNRKTRKG